MFRVRVAPDPDTDPSWNPVYDPSALRWYATQSENAFRPNRSGSLKVTETAAPLAEKLDTVGGTKSSTRLLAPAWPLLPAGSVPWTKIVTGPLAVPRLEDWIVTEFP